MKTSLSNSQSKGQHVRNTLIIGCLLVVLPVAAQVSGFADDTESIMGTMPKSGVEYGRRPPAEKPRVPVSITYELGGEPSVGKRVDLTIGMSSDIDTDSLQIRVLPEPGLLLLDALDSTNFGPLHKAESRKFGVSFIPQREGAFRVRLAISLDQRGGALSGIVTVPVFIGAKDSPRLPELPRGAKAGIDEDGQPMVVFPVQSHR